MTVAAIAPALPPAAPDQPPSAWENIVTSLDQVAAMTHPIVYDETPGAFGKRLTRICDSMDGLKTMVGNLNQLDASQMAIVRGRLNGIYSDVSVDYNGMIPPAAVKLVYQRFLATYNTVLAPEVAPPECDKPSPAEQVRDQALEKKVIAAQDELGRVPGGSWVDYWTTNLDASKVIALILFGLLIVPVAAITDAVNKSRFHHAQDKLDALYAQQNANFMPEEIEEQRCIDQWESQIPAKPLSSIDRFENARAT